MRFIVVFLVFVLPLFEKAINYKDPSSEIAIQSALGSYSRQNYIIPTKVAKPSDLLLKAKRGHIRVSSVSDADFVLRDYFYTGWCVLNEA